MRASYEFNEYTRDYDALSEQRELVKERCQHSCGMLKGSLKIKETETIENEIMNCLIRIAFPG